MKQTRRNKSAFLLPVLFAGILFTSCNSSRSDADIQKDVREELTTSEGNRQAYANINAEVKEGVVTLTGQCEGDNCADSVLARVNDVDGVKEVRNNITQAQGETDYTLRSNVQTIISKYQGVQADVVNGTVVLRGTIQREQVQPLMNELGILQAKKVDNQLAIQ